MLQIWKLVRVFDFDRTFYAKTISCKPWICCSQFRECGEATLSVFDEHFNYFCVLSIAILCIFQCLWLKLEIWHGLTWGHYFLGPQISSQKLWIFWKNRHPICAKWAQTEGLWIVPDLFGEAKIRHRSNNGRFFFCQSTLMSHEAWANRNYTLMTSYHCWKKKKTTIFGEVIKDDLFHFLLPPGALFDLSTKSLMMPLMWLMLCCWCSFVMPSFIKQPGSRWKYGTILF